MGTEIDGRFVGVEVKAPYRETPSDGKPWSGHDSDLLEQCLVSANKQFCDDVPNILVIVPQLRTSVHDLRVQLVTALYGQEMITCPIDTRTGGPAGPVTTEFFPDGRLLRQWQPSGSLIKPNGTPGFTRVSAVVVIEEFPRERHPNPIETLWKEISAGIKSAALVEAWKRQLALHFGPDNYCWIDHKVLVAHNPNARHPLLPAVFREHVQFVDTGKWYGWSDGEAL